MYYNIQFLENWHCGSGLSAGPGADLITIKDEDKLPYVPGKTIKGLFREAISEMRHYSNDSCFDSFDECFGSKAKNNGTGITAGRLHFTNCIVGKQLADFYSISSKKPSNLYKEVSSTCIGKEGTAVDYSLRKIEVTIPLPLIGEIKGVHEEDKAMLIKAFKWVRRIGLNRNRGLGKCIITSK